MSGPELTGTREAVASTHWLATAAAMSVLDRGGNAFDAAVAGASVLAVVEPDQNSLGGEVTIVLRTADGNVRVICGQGPMPAAATPRAFAALGLDLIPGSGVLPACVPGAFDAWMVLLAEFGTWSVRAVFADAIAYAGGGFPVSPGLARRIAGVADHFRDHWLTSAEVFLPRGHPSAGSRLCNPALATTLERLATEAERADGARVARIAAARRAWRQGFVPEAAFRWLERTDVTDLEGRTDRALLDREDWTTWFATIEHPVSGRFGEATLHKPGVWSQGPVLIEALGILDALDIGVLREDPTEHAHVVIEALKLALADREAWYGDPVFADVPLDALTSREYARERATSIEASASRELRPGSPDARQPRLPSRLASFVGADIAERTERAARALASGGDTSHIEVADSDGNVVSAAPSGAWLQSSPVIPDLGFPLGTRGQMLWLEEGLANSLAPRKRPRTTLSPSIVVHDDGTVIGCGSPGGDGQDQWTLQFLVRHLVEALPLQSAADHPTFQSLHMPLSFWPREARPGVIQLERGWDERVREGLRARGHLVEEIPEGSQGWACAVARSADGLVSAAASVRGRNCTALVR